MNEGYFGKYRGIVADTSDPDNLGRIKVQVPALFGEAVLEAWTWPCIPLAGKDANGGFGNWNPPVKGDGVWVEFEMGSVDHPSYSGYWWAEGEMPEEFKNRKTYGLITPGGSKILVDDEAGIIKVISKDKVLVEGEGEVEVKGKTKVVVTGQDVSVEATGSATVKAGGNVSVEAGGVLDLSGALAKIQGGGPGLARLGDQIVVMLPPIPPGGIPAPTPLMGTISQGSTKALCGG